MIIKEIRIASNENHATALLFLRCESVNAYTEYPPHQHDWGQIICVKSGVFALDIEGQRFLAPSGFAVWIPPQMEHSSHNQKSTRFRSINISPRWCQALPKKPCILHLSTLCTAIIDDLFDREVYVPQVSTDRRLCRVLVDQLASAPLQHTYLPTSTDKYLAPILEALENNPSDRTSLTDWAKSVHTTDRTLARRCQKDLGMSFSEWRQRLRFLYGLSLLEQGETVQNIALEVGYSTSSAFIAAFQSIMGVTPERYRRCL